MFAPRNDKGNLDLETWGDDTPAAAYDKRESYRLFLWYNGVHCRDTAARWYKQFQEPR